MTFNVPEFTWTTVLTGEQITAFHDRTAAIDPAFARKDRAFMESRTAAELSALVTQAWNCNDRTAYVMARSYLQKLAA